MQEPQQTPVISALIVSYNSAALLRRSLAALEASQQRELLEILVVDNGSRDESPTLDTEFPGATFLRLPRNFGRGKALNIGTRTAKGEFLFLLDPGIEVTPDALPALVARLGTERDAIAVCPLMVNAAGEPLTRDQPLPDPKALQQAWRGRPLPSSTPDLSREVTPLTYPAGSPILVRRQFVVGMNYFDQRYGESWTDAELSFQIQRAQKKILLLPAVRVYRSESDRDEAMELDDSARAVLAADAALGAVTYINKRYGWVAGLKSRISAVLYALGQALLSLVRFRGVRYHWGLLAALVSGQKVDGSQRAL